MEIKKISHRSTIFKYTLSEWNLNLHLITGEKYNYVIDTGLGSKSVAPLLEQIKEDPKLVIVINTHHHWDHVWGNCSFSGCAIVSHRLCRETADGEWEGMMEKYKEYIRGDVKKSLPNMTFDKEMYFPDDGILLFHTPGHTIDSISVFDERDGVLNAGDNIGDTPDKIVPDLDCVKEAYLETLDKYKRLDIKFCVSGHNVVQGREVVDRILAAL